MAQNNRNQQQFNKFILNNQPFLQAKYSQYFSNIDNLKQISNQQIITYVYDVFGLSKYQDNDEANTTIFNSLINSYQNYVKQFKRQDIKFNHQTAIELLRYCIKNNKMFAVQYDQGIKDNQNIQSASKQTQNNKRKIKQQNQKNISKQNQLKKEILSSQEKEQINQKVISNNQNKVEEDQVITLLNNNQQTKEEFLQENLMINQFSVHEQNKDYNLTQLETKKLKSLFDFYCKHLQGISINNTFDRINHQCNSINLGKFIVFCNATQVYNKQSKLTKQKCVKQFKKIAQGKQDIQFETFQQLISRLIIIDSQLIKRLAFNNIEKFKQKKKMLSLPFNSKNKQQLLKEVKKNYKVLPKPTKVSQNTSKNQYMQQKPQITHKDILDQNIKIKKTQNRQIQTKTILLNQSSKIKKQKKVQEQNDLNFLQKLIPDQQKDDQIWLKDYKLPSKQETINLNYGNYYLNTQKNANLIKSIKKRVKQLQRTQQKNQKLEIKRITKSAMKTVKL